MGWWETSPGDRYGWFLAALLLAVFIAGPVLQWISVSILVLPFLAAFTLAWFIYSLWGRKFLRARRIQNIRERRLWNEAQKRR